MPDIQPPILVNIVEIDKANHLGKIFRLRRPNRMLLRKIFTGTLHAFFVRRPCPIAVCKCRTLLRYGNLQKIVPVLWRKLSYYQTLSLHKDNRLHSHFEFSSIHLNLNRHTEIFLIFACFARNRRRHSVKQRIGAGKRLRRIISETKRQIDDLTICLHQFICGKCHPSVTDVLGNRNSANHGKHLLKFHKRTAADPAKLPIIDFRRKGILDIRNRPIQAFYLIQCSSLPLQKHCSTIRRKIPCSLQQKRQGIKIFLRKAPHTIQQYYFLIDIMSDMIKAVSLRLLLSLSFLFL